MPKPTPRERLAGRFRSTVRQMYAADFTTAEICELVDAVGYQPSPEEITARCREIQAGWSHIAERQHRSYDPPTAVEIPTVELGGKLLLNLGQRERLSAVRY